MRVGIVTVMLIVGVATATPAWAAGLRLRITGHRHVRTGARIMLRVTGEAGGSARGLAVYVGPRSCARTVEGEQRRRNRQQLLVKAVSHHFVEKITFLRSSAGTHVMCAYLYHVSGGGFRTDVRAQFQYVTS
jgi:hypothetical protein